MIFLICYVFFVMQFGKYIDEHVILLIFSHIHIAGPEFVVPGKLHND